MEESTNKEKILKKIRTALLTKTPDPFPHLDHEKSVFVLSDEDPVVIFSEQFTLSGGKFILCENELEFAEGLLNCSEQNGWKNIYCNDPEIMQLLISCDFPFLSKINDPTQTVVMITGCECLIARNGTVVVSSASASIFNPVYAPVHVVFAKSSRIAFEIKDALHWLKNKYAVLPSDITFITGNSYTLQLNNERTEPGHGSTAVYLFLLDDKDRGYIIDSAPEEEEN